MDFSDIVRKYVRSEVALRNLMNEIRRVDPEVLEMCRRVVLQRSLESPPSDELENPPYHFYEEGDPEVGKKSFWHFGFLTLAGGSATRFFSELTEPVPFRSKALFPFTQRCNFLDIFAGEILASSLKAGCISPWIIMVSDNTADEILEYVRKEPYGFPPEFLLVIKQGVLPRFDDDGLPVVSKDGFLSWTGNGHGGVFFALLDDTRKVLLNRSVPERNVKRLLIKMGVRHLVLHNVDNVFSRPTDFRRLGFHISQKALFTMSVVERKDVAEKIGLVTYIPRESKFHVLEYSFADPKIFERMSDDGPYYNLGQINVNLFSLQVVDQKYLKKLRPVLYTGKTVSIDGVQMKVNTVEFLNHMIANVLPAHRVRVLVVERKRFFLPTKTIKGEDSLLNSREKYFSFIREFMETRGVRIPESSSFELAPYIVFGNMEIFDTRNWFVDEDTVFYFGAVFSSGRYCISDGFKLLKGASFSVETSRPFGRLVIDGRKIKGVHNPPRVTIGRNVTIKGKLDVKLDEGSELLIRDGKEVSGELKLRLDRFQRFII